MPCYPFASLFAAAAVLAMVSPAQGADEIIVMALPQQSMGKPIGTPELAAMRGGVQLPNGLNLSVGIDIQTRVDGVLVLHSIYATDGPIVGTRLFTDGATPSDPVPAQESVSVPGGMTYPVISVSRSNLSPGIAPGAAGPPVTINLINDPQANWVPANGQQAVPVTLDGPPVSANAGQFGLVTTEGGTAALYQTDTLEIRHLIGQATGVVVANTASDRTIDTTSAVNIELRGAEPLLAAGQFIASALALDIVRGR